MKSALADQLKASPIYSRLSEQDLSMLAGVASSRLYCKGDVLFGQGDAADRFITLVRGRVKVSKATPGGKDLILALLGPGDPVGAVAVYLETDFPATAEALEDTVCVEIPASSLYSLLDRSPSLVRGLLLGMTRRLMELTSRLAVLSGSRVEPRFARLLLKLSEEIGTDVDGGRLIPLRLSRQELADLTGTTIETTIRIMSRWGKAGTVLTEERGFLIPDRRALKVIADA